MSTHYCPKCDAVIPTSAMNLEQGVALCPQCESLLPLANLLERTKPKVELLEEFPQGCSLQRKRGERGQVTLAKASTRSLGTAVFFVFFSAFWNGITSIFVFVAITGLMQHYTQGEIDWLPDVKFNDEHPSEGNSLGGLIFLCVFLIPFVVIGWVTAITALMGIFGKVEVELSYAVGKVKTGVWCFAWSRRFDPREIETVSKDISSARRNNQKVELIVLEGKKTIKFGSMLNKKRREWMQVVLEIILTEPENTESREILLAKANKQG